MQTVSPIKKYLNPISQLPKGAIVLSVVSIFGVLFGFLREATIAYYFGASTELDTFLVALTIPQVLAVTLPQITLAVILPIYVTFRQQKKNAEATALVQNWFWFLALSIAAICLIIYVLAEPLTRQLAPGFSNNQAVAAARWTRILLPFTWLLGTASVFAVVSNANGRFFVPAISRQLTSIMVIVSCALTAKLLGITSLTVGFLIGGVCGFAWQLHNCRIFEKNVPGKILFTKSISLPYMACLTMLVSYLLKQSEVFLDRAFASALPSGSISALSFAAAINAIPSTIVISAIGTAIFPILSRLAAANKLAEAISTARQWSITICMAGIIPIIILAIFSEQIVSIIFARGAFNETGVSMTADILGIIAFKTMFQIPLVMYTLLLLALKRNRTVAFAAMLQFLFKFSFCYYLVDPMGLKGLAYASLIAMGVATFALIMSVHIFQKKEAK